MSIPSVTVGQGLQGSKQGFGCMSLTAGFYGASCPEVQGIAVLQRALKAGAKTISTADFYGDGANETLIGKAIKSMPRSSVVICDKWGPIFKPGQPMSFDASREAGQKRIDATLQRLGVDYIDVWILRCGGKPEGLEDTYTLMKEMVDAGKVKHLGVSEMSPADVRKVHKIHPVSLVELEWSLLSRDSEKELVPTCRELGIGMLAYSPMGRGLLTGAFKPDELPDDDFRKSIPGTYYSRENVETNLKAVAKISEMAKARGVTAGQLALAWVHSRGKDVIPIPGTKTEKYLDANVQAASLELSSEECQQLEAAASLVQGERYPGGHGTFDY